jgi:excinuclease Cho
MRTHVNSVGLLVCSDPALSFSPPAHIPRDCIDALPPLPGIYIFRDAAGSAIYIGKSVNIRNRVLSHLRTPDEAQMLARTTHIDFERTGGEIGALLREAQLIRREQPVFNQKLRRLRDMCSISLAEAQPQIVFAADMDFALTDHLYGLFASRKGALEALRDLAQAHALCLACLGLERVAAGRPCFGRQIGKCRGVCIGEESKAEHALRLQAALVSLRIERWPYAGPVAIVEETDGLRQRQLVDRWSYLGTKMTKRAASAARFDMDVYQILARPLLAGQLTVEVL